MKIRKAVATAAAAATAMVIGMIGGPTAAAEEVPGHEPTARLVSVVVEPGSTVAEVTAEYRCWTEVEGQYDHLWVSVKQGGKDLEGEGSSQRARSWYDSHPVGADAPVCDGTPQLQTFEVTMHDGYKHLNRSEAWVQFCLVQLADPSDEEAPPLHFLSENRWMKVQAAPSVR